MFRLLFVATMFAALMPQPARAGVDDEAINAVIATWYTELQKRKDGRYWSLLAPGGIIAPDYKCRDDNRPRMRSADPNHVPFPHLLAVRAEKFAYEIKKSTVETTLARIRVWERGWIYARAAKTTYENAADASFIMEKIKGAWRVVLYASHSSAVHPDHRDDPMPDLSPKQPPPLLNQP